MDMKPSAYRSVTLAKQGKNKTDGGLKTWFGEKWRNLTPLTLGDNQFYNCGTQSDEQRKMGLPSVCRPTVKKAKSTPTLAQNYSISQIKKAVKIKQQGKVIQWREI
jgi:hypothetical protein